MCLRETSESVWAPNTSLYISSACIHFRPLIGGFRGGAEGGAAPPFFLNFQNVLKGLRSRICPQCCMLHVLEREVFIRGGWGWGIRPIVSEFSGSAPATCRSVCPGLYLVLFKSRRRFCLRLLCPFELLSVQCESQIVDVLRCNAFPGNS